jgi:hypothetical protein
MRAAALRYKGVMRVFAVLLAGYAALGAAKLDPPFKSEMHEPRAEDAGVIRALRGVDPETHFLLIHGHFVGGGKETVVAVAYAQCRAATRCQRSCFLSLPLDGNQGGATTN